MPEFEARQMERYAIETPALLSTTDQNGRRESFALMTKNISSGAPFVPGQVVVAGDPSTLPTSYDVIKYLPNANLTVVKVDIGREWGHIQALQAKGFRANLNLIAKASLTPTIQITQTNGISRWFRVSRPGIYRLAGIYRLEKRLSWLCSMPGLPQLELKMESVVWLMVMIL